MHRSSPVAGGFVSLIRGPAFTGPALTRSITYSPAFVKQVSKGKRATAVALSPSTTSSLRHDPMMGGFLLSESCVGGTPVTSWALMLPTEPRVFVGLSLVSDRLTFLSGLPSRGMSCCWGNCSGGCWRRMLHTLWNRTSMGSLNSRPRCWSHVSRS